MVYGSYDLILDNHEQIYAFIRTLDDNRLLVILNFSQDTSLFELPEEISFKNKKLIISNYPLDPKENIRNLPLQPYEARVYLLW